MVTDSTYTEYIEDNSETTQFKMSGDLYIDNLCKEYPKLHEYYDLLNNKGYGTRKHIEGIKKYGISPWHRKSFSTCRHHTINQSEYYLDSNINESEDDLPKQTV